MTLVILCNLNLPPEQQYKAKNILVSLIIPSQRKYKNLDSFLQPLVDELLELEHGVDAFDGDSRAPFRLRAWVTLVTGRH